MCPGENSPKRTNHFKPFLDTVFYRPIPAQNQNKSIYANKTPIFFGLFIDCVIIFFIFELSVRRKMALQRCNHSAPNPDERSKASLNLVMLSF